MLSKLSLVISIKINISIACYVFFRETCVLYVYVQVLRAEKRVYCTFTWWEKRVLRAEKRVYCAFTWWEKRVLRAEKRVYCAFTCMCFVQRNVCCAFTCRCFVQRNVCIVRLRGERNVCIVRLRGERNVCIVRLRAGKRVYWTPVRKRTVRRKNAALEIRHCCKNIVIYFDNYYSTCGLHCSSNHLNIDADNVSKLVMCAASLNERNWESMICLNFKIKTK